MEDKLCVHWLCLAIDNSSSFFEAFCLLGCDAVSVGTRLPEEPASCLFRIEQVAEDSFDILVAMYQITWCHIPNTTMLIVTSVRTSNIIVVSVVNNIIPTEYAIYPYQISGICTHFITDHLVSKIGYSVALNIY
jgi:hypothetical protein